jgi:hypothetical protein
MISLLNDESIIKPSGFSTEYKVLPCPSIAGRLKIMSRLWSRIFGMLQIRECFLKELQGGICRLKV